jgi:hypothetical protein
MRKLKQKSDGYQLSLASSFTAPSSSSSTISTQSAGPAAVNLEVMNGIADIRSALASGRTAPNKVLQTIKRLVDLSAGTATVCNDNSTSNDASTTTSNAADRQLISEASLRAIDIAKANVYQYYGQDALVRLLIASGAGSSPTNDFINSRNSNCETADILLCRLVWMEFESGAISAQQAVAKLKQSQPSHTPLSRSRRFHVIHTIKHLLFQHYINM